MEESLNNDQGDDVGTGSSRPTNRPDSRVWHGINQTSAIFGFPPAVARDSTGRELHGFGDARPLHCWLIYDVKRKMNICSKLFSVCLAQEFFLVN